MFGGFKSSKLKPQLKMAVSRFQIASNKKTALMKQQMREIAKLLAEEPQPKEEKARIRAESLIREDNTIEAYEILQLECELLAERIKLIASAKTCPEDLKSCVATLMWATDRVDVPELIEVRKQFRAKYGKKFEEDAMKNVGNVLNERVVAKLSVQPPSAYLVQTYLEKIADEYEVDWKPKVKLTAEEMANPMAAPDGYSVEVGGGTGLGAVTGQGHIDSEVNYVPSAPVDKGDMPPGAPAAMATPYVPVLPPPAVPSTDDIEEVDIFVPGAPTAPPGKATNETSNGHNGYDNDADESTGGDNGGESYDDLAKRFAALHK